MSEKLCPKCGAEVLDQAVTCPKCGVELAKSPADSDVFAAFLMGDDAAEPKAEAGEASPGEPSDSGLKRGADESAGSSESGDKPGAGEAADSGVQWPTEPSDSGVKWSSDDIAAESQEPIDSVAPEPVDSTEPVAPSESDKTHISRTPPLQPSEDVEGALFGHDAAEQGAEDIEFESGAGEPEPARSPALAPLAPVSTAGPAMAAPGKLSLLAVVGSLLAGLVLGGGGGAGAIHFLMLRPKVAELNSAQDEKSRLKTELAKTQSDKASADETVKQTEGELAKTKNELEKAQKEATDADAKATQANNDKAQLARSRATAEAERELVKLEADGAAILALNPELILAGDLLPRPAELQASPELAKLWTEYFAHAETLLGEAIKGNPNRARNYALRAWAYQARGGDQAAIEADVKKALDLDAPGQDPVVQFVAARIYEQMGKSEDAAKHMSAAAKAGPATGSGPSAVAPASIAERRGEILRQVALARAASERGGQLTDTLRLLQRALDLEPKDAKAADRVALRQEQANLLLKRGSQLQSNGQVEQAVAALQAAAEVAAQAAEIAQSATLDSAATALYTQGRALELLGKLDDALQAFEAGSPLARDDAEKSRFAAARARVRTAKAGRASANTPQSGGSFRNSVELAVLYARLLEIPDDAKKPEAKTQQPAQPDEKPAKKPEATAKPDSDEPKPPEPDKTATEPAKQEKPAPVKPPEPVNPELEKALREADQAIKDSGGKSADAFYAKGVVLSAMKRFDPALEAFLAGAAQLNESADVSPEQFIHAVAAAYRQRALTPHEIKIVQLEEQVTGLSDGLQQKTAQLSDVTQKLETTSLTLSETSKQLADTKAELAERTQTLAAREQTLANERVELQSERDQHDLWMGRYKGLMVGTSEEDQRESTKLYSQALNQFFAGKYSAAVETLTEAIHLHPRDARYRYYRGLAYYRQNSLAQAENDLKEASALERQDAPRRRDVDRALLRVQGKERLWLESFRPEL